jgi:hypothetical protein
LIERSYPAVASVARAFEIYLATPTRNQVLVASGMYTTAAALLIPDGVGVYGGYAPVFTMRSDTRATLTASSATALRAMSLTQPTVLDRINVTTTNRTVTGESSVAVVVVASGENLTMRFSTVTAGRGGDASVAAKSSALRSKPPLAPPSKAPAASARLQPGQARIVSNNLRRQNEERRRIELANKVRAGEVCCSCPCAPSPPAVLPCVG